MVQAALHQPVAVQEVTASHCITIKTCRHFCKETLTSLLVTVPTSQPICAFKGVICDFSFLSATIVHWLVFVCLLHHDPCSIFVMTNETVNIWTHLIGFIIFSVLLMDDILLYLPENNAIWSDYVVFIVMDICFQVSVHNIIMPPDVVYWLCNRISLTS